MNNKDLEAIGLRIRERRTALGMTQTGLAQKLGITAQAVSKWETGMGCPDVYVLPDLSRALETSIDALLGVVPMPAVEMPAAPAQEDAEPEFEEAPEAAAEEIGIEDQAAQEPVVEEPTEEEPVIEKSVAEGSAAEGPAEQETITEKDVVDGPAAPDFFSDGEQAFRDAEAWMDSFTEKPKEEEEWIPHLTTDPYGEEEQAAQQAQEHAADPVYTVHKDEYTPRPREYVHGQAQEEKREETPKEEPKAQYNYTNYRRPDQQQGQQYGQNQQNWQNRQYQQNWQNQQSRPNYGGTGRAPYSNVPPFGEAPRGNTPGFDGAAFAQEISRMVNSAVNAAVGAAKTAKNEVQRAAAGSESIQLGYNNGKLLRGLNLDLAGAGEVIVHAGIEAPWQAQIRAPEAMFTRIVCQEEDGILFVRIPQASQFGFFGFNPQVRVEIYAGFTLGESLTLNLRGSSNVQIEPDFVRSDIHVAGSGDVEMKNAGKLTYSVAGSGDFSFGNAEDTSIRISGSSDVSCGVLTGNTKIHISGSGDFEAEAVFGRLEAVSTGSGDFDVSNGRLDELHVRCSGSGDFYAPTLEVVNAEVRVSGGGSVVLGSVSGRLDKHLSSIASLKIRR